MNDHDIKGIKVISVSDADQLGTLERAFVDVAARKVVGFGFHKSGGFLRAESNPLIDTADIQSFGEDVLTLANPAMVRGEQTTARYAELVDLARLHGERVVTEAGQAIGTIKTVEFDEHSYRLTGIEVGAGYFEQDRLIAIEDVVTIGVDVTVIRDSVVAAAHEPVPDAPSMPLDAVGDTEHATAFQEQTIEIPISGERLEIERSIEETEEVAITKEAVERDQSVTETVQHEEVLVEAEMDPNAAAEEAHEVKPRMP